MWESPEYRAKQSAGQRAAIQSENRAKVSANSKKMWESPEFRAKHRAAMRAAYARRKAAKQSTTP